MLDVVELVSQLEADPRNASYTERGIPPVFQLSEDARVLLIGQAPGAHVERTLVPFADKSGDTLMRWLGVDKDIFYSERIAIMPMDFYYPGKGKTGDLPPRPFIAKEYHQELLAMMPHVQLTILIGSYAQRYYLHGRMKKNLTETVRAYAEYLPQYFPIVHPSPLNFRWQAKNPWFEVEVVPQLQEFVAKALFN